jgi:glycosyltransferase involved in cell wall biosynthesis
MNIVFVSKECPPSPRSCGIGTYVWETGNARARMGHNVTIIAASDDGRSISSAPSPRLTLIRLPDDELGTEKRHIVARTLGAPMDQGKTYRTRVADCIEALDHQQRPDIIEFPGFRGESVIWLKRRHRVPMVARMHGLTAGINAVWKDHVSATRRLQLSWERRELESSDAITVVSEHMAGPVCARFGADRVRVVYNSIDAGRWRKLSADAPQEVDSNDILFAGSLLRAKGIFVLLRAAALLRKTGWRGRLFLAGRTTPQFERFFRVRRALGIKLPDWVIRLGVCRRERLPGLYRDAGVCCFPSLIEPFSYTCLEAMSCGGLVVGSLRTGMAEIITPTTGFLVPPGEIPALADTLASALSLKNDERRRMKGCAQQRIQDRFDNGIVIPELVSCYEEVISKTRC